jgi:hypothetical protein
MQVEEIPPASGKDGRYPPLNRCHNRISKMENLTPVLNDKWLRHSAGALALGLPVRGVRLGKFSPGNVTGGLIGELRNLNGQLNQVGGKEQRII